MAQNLEIIPEVPESPVQPVVPEQFDKFVKYIDDDDTSVCQKILCFLFFCGVLFVVLGTNLIAFNARSINPSQNVFIIFLAILITGVICIILFVSSCLCGMCNQSAKRRQQPSA